MLKIYPALPLHIYGIILPLSHTAALKGTAEKHGVAVPSARPPQRSPPLSRHGEWARGLTPPGITLLSPRSRATHLLVLPTHLIALAPATMSTNPALGSCMGSIGAAGHPRAFTSRRAGQDLPWLTQGTPLLASLPLRHESPAPQARGSSQRSQGPGRSAPINMTLHAHGRKAEKNVLPD